MLKYIAKEDNKERYKDVNSYHSITVEPLKVFRPYPSIPNFKRNSYCENYCQCCHCYNYITRGGESCEDNRQTRLEIQNLSQ